MTNNDTLRRIRYIFDINDDNMIKIFSLADCEVNRKQVSAWLKKDDDENFVKIYDNELAFFLNGFISFKRGKKDGTTPVPEKYLTNNIVLRKLKIALNMRDDEMLKIFDLAGLQISRSELSALFRKPSDDRYRKCKDQFLRNFIYGLQAKYREKK